MPEYYVLQVIQGYSIEEYLNCIELYDKYGIDLKKLPLVGLGSICRRQNEKEGISIIKTIGSLGINIHGFGLKTSALKYVKSTDSMSWSVSRFRDSQKGKEIAELSKFEYMVRWRNSLAERGLIEP